MARYVKGDVVVGPFPFSDLTQSKRRPALVIAELAGDDVVLCQITSQNVKDSYVIPLDTQDLYLMNLGRHASIKKSIKRRVDRVLGDPYRNTELLGDVFQTLSDDPFIHHGAI